MCTRSYCKREGGWLSVCFNIFMCGTQTCLSLVCKGGQQARPSVRVIFVKVHLSTLGASRDTVFLILLSAKRFDPGGLLQ